MKLGRELLSFGVIGVVGFFVDVAVLYLAAPLLGFYGGRIVSFWAAASTTWALNRRFTFAHGAAVQRASIWREYIAYLATMMFGAVLNYGAYVLTLHWVHAAWAPVLGVALGSLAGLGANFLSARYLIFKAR